ATGLKISALSNVVELVAGRFFTCALVADGGVWCLGQNASGQLGAGGSFNASGIPVHASVSSVVALAAGDKDACAILVDGSAACWGDNSYGQLGSGGPAFSSVPVAVPFLTG